MLIHISVLFLDILFSLFVKPGFGEVGEADSSHAVWSAVCCKALPSAEVPLCPVDHAGGSPVYVQGPWQPEWSRHGPHCWMGRSISGKKIFHFNCHFIKWGSNVLYCNTALTINSFN